MARSPRNATVLHMIVAMVVLMVPILAITAFFTRTPEPPVQAVAYEPAARQAAAQAAYPVLVPASLPEGWTPTRARWTPAGQPGLGGDPVPGDTWQLGFLSPQQTYVALDQRDRAPGPFVAATTREGRPDGEVAVSGAPWTRYVSADGRTRALVRQGEAVTIVSGDLPYEALAAFASTLVEAPKG